MTEHEPKSNEILEMCRQHFNEPILAFLKVGRVIGYGEDKYDCYLIVKHSEGVISWYSATGGYTFLDCLKGQQYVKSIAGEEWDDFFRLDSDLHYSDCPKEEEFLIDLRPEQDWEWETDDNV